jgi:dihydrofolate reductase
MPSFHKSALSSMISIIAAIGNNNVIGCKNSLPWHLPADLNYFKEKTLGKTIVMGQKTFESVGSKPLPGRKTIILNNNENYKAPEGCKIARSIDELVEMTKEEGEIMICGGASVYRQFMPLAHRLYITFIHGDFEGDTFFPEIDKEQWKEVKRTDNKADDKNAYDYSFVIFERKL